MSNCENLHVRPEELDEIGNVLSEDAIRDHVSCDPICMKCPEQANPQRQEVDRRRPGAGGDRDGSDCQ